MSDYAYIPRKTKNLYDPSGRFPFRLSRSKIDLFLNCPRCFYMDRRLGVSQPPGFPFNLNSAVDHLLKKEFDYHRLKQIQHPLQKAYGLDCVPFLHQLLDIWRENFKGIEYLHVPSNFLVTGAVDDVWVNSKGELVIVDYKSTAKDGEISIDAEWQIAYKRQMEVYQWLFRQNGFQVSSTGYFVYCNGKRDAKGFDAKLEFTITLIPYEGRDAWIEPTLRKAKVCLDGSLPESGPECDYCKYRKAAAEVEGELSEIKEAVTIKPIRKKKNPQAPEAQTLF